MIEKANPMYTSMDYDVPPSFTTTRRTISKQKLYARALYDNIADTPDELAFKKGEILNVIEQDTDGLGGWWLCSLRNRQGICPGNRLRILHSYDSGCFSPSPASSPCPSLAASTATLNSSILSSDIYENSSIISGNNQQMQHSSLHGQQIQSQSQHHLYNSQGKRRSWHKTPHKVITPHRCGDVYLYDWPSPSNRSSPYQNCSIISDSETYDTPKSATPVNYDCPKNWSKAPKKHDSIFTSPKMSSDAIPAHLLEESYDIPKPINLLHQQNMTPSSSNSSLLTSDSYSMSFSSSNRSSLANMPDYDIPRRNPIPIRSSNHPASHMSHQHYSHHQQSSTYDYPQPSVMVQNQQQPQQQQQQQQQQKPQPQPRVTKELPLELSSALEMLAKLQNEATTAITRLLAFVTPDWRNREKLEPVVMDIKLAAVRLRTALHDLTEFSEGALGNASRADDRTLSLKLRPLVKALKDADHLIHTTSQMLDMHGWSIDQLLRSEQKVTPPPDNLDQLMACAQTLIEDVRQSTSFIQGNAPLLFKRIPETQIANNQNNQNNCNNNNNNNGDNEWLEDYDYVKFDSKETAAKKNSELRDAIPQNMKKKFDNIIKAAESSSLTGEIQTELNPNDKLVVKYYAAQITNHMGYLTQAIDSFLETVEKNQPPKFFIAYGKFVVFSAHNLVGIGDSVHRNVSKQELKDKIERYTDALSDALKTCVTKSKKAAQHFPSVTAVQEMVDSVVDISHLASDLKIAMLQVVQQVI